MRLVVLLLLLLGAAEASIGRTYKELSSVPVVVNNIGPLGNPAERYEYYSLPFCAPSDVHNKKENFGEVLAGDRRTSSLYDLRFRADNALVRICKFSLNQNEIKWFRDAIKQHYVFEFFVDDLPVQGFVGEKESYLQQFGPHVHNETQYFLFTHLDFAVQYNGDRVIAVKLTTDPERRVLLEFGEDIPVEFSYSVKWTETHVRYVNRMSLHSKNLISQQFVEIHWLSIINSVVLVVLLTTFLGIILMRILKKDIAGYMAADDDELATGEDEEGGWKLVHGDVFRPPAYLMLFSAAVGNGTQILTGVCGLLALSLMGTFYPGNHGTMYTAAIVLYAMTASISGYVSTRLYISLGGKSWAINVVLTACLFAMPAFAVFALNNSIALSYGSTTALPLSTILVILTLWALVTFPLTIIGAKRGQENAETYDAPCKTKHARRLIPEQPWYRSTVFQVCTAGFLPFSAIYIELHYLFATVWGHHVYTLFGILVLAFILLLIVTAFVTVALTYFQLAAEDWRWWWRSFLSGASTSLFVLGYAVFFFNYRSQMDGLMQTSFFFGYVLLISYAFALMLGTVSFFVTESFVHYLYASIKVD